MQNDTDTLAKPPPAESQPASIDKFIGVLNPVDLTRDAIRKAYLADEGSIVDRLVVEAELEEEQLSRIDDRARRLVEDARRNRTKFGGIDEFLNEYALSSREGVVLMCLAEALLRIPDAETADRLIKDKLVTANWETHLGKAESVLVNAATWGLMLTGRVVGWDEKDDDLAGLLGRLISRSGEPIVRRAVKQAMRILGRQFVMGATIEKASARSRDSANRRYLYSFDMLGEAAHTKEDALRYLDAYRHAIESLKVSAAGGSIVDAPGISVKLSALHPRYEAAQSERTLCELTPRLIDLCERAKGSGIGLTVDAEEAARLDLSLEIIDRVLAAPSLADWDGLGMAIQAYQKRAPMVIDWFAARARAMQRRVTVRLVKGAYWDSEIKRAQELGLESYPVFTRKASTDVSYIACVKRLLAARDVIYPQFATHNAHTVAVVEALFGDSRDYEFQRLHGMGEALYAPLVDAGEVRCRVYAPVGSHEELLPYLVRRLLENGANTSFVNRLTDEEAPVGEIVADPIAKVAALPEKPHPAIPLPAHMLGDGRVCARGLDLTDPLDLSYLADRMGKAMSKPWEASPIVGGKSRTGAQREVLDPSDCRRVVGTVIETAAADVAACVEEAAVAADDWDRTDATRRALALESMAGLLEVNLSEMMALCVREGGKTVPDALAEVREAVDFCRYYAARARELFATPQSLPGPTGESNELALHGRGVFACISPWNFPLAIFVGQVAAALAAGNAVIAKPAEQTPLTAAAAVRLMHRAGIPEDVLHLLPGDGVAVGAPLVADPRVAGVAFTGSTETARAINLALAQRPGPIAPLIAETGGQNAMIVDSSALPEQVITDVISSAFHSAGQRCSALRILFVQEDVAPRIERMLVGAMEELVVGDPGLLSTDIGPVIDEDARATLQAHMQRMQQEGRELYRVPLPSGTEHGTFVSPAAFEIGSLSALEREVFGPVLHVIPYAADRLDQVLASIRSTGYGLTLGVHSRIDETIAQVHRSLPVGNVYVNRNMVGAVVGVQPFGGQGLSGTGPKAGGPHYLQRFAVERTLTVNTAATGGNAALLSLATE